MQVLAAGLATDLPASVFVVLHIGAGIDGKSFLPEILTRAGGLPVKHPVDSEKIRRAQIYVAPLNCHMLLRPGRVHLLHGPKENRTQPAINPLFRSAAAAYGSNAHAPVYGSGVGRAKRPIYSGAEQPVYECGPGRESSHNALSPPPSGGEHEKEYLILPALHARRQRRPTMEIEQERKEA